jgi:hypothetical protein
VPMRLRDPVDAIQAELDLGTRRRAQCKRCGWSMTRGGRSVCWHFTGAA